MVICAGTQGSGKTVLCQKLAKCDRDFIQPNKSDLYVIEDEGFELKTLPTVGVNHYQVDVSLIRSGKKKKKKSDSSEIVVVRELGGELACAWTSYIQSDRDLIFLIDLSDLISTSSACIHLIKLLEHLAIAESNEKAHVLIIYSKTDRLSSKSELETRLVQIRSLLRLTYFKAWYESRVAIEELQYSAIDSPIGGVAYVKNWLRNRKNLNCL